jgi:hypothetical protein
VFDIVLKPLSSLVLWLMLGAAAGVLGSGFTLFRGWDDHIAEHENALTLPVRADTQRYSAKFVAATRKAEEEYRDLLADYETFAAAWSEVSPGEPMLLQIARPESFDESLNRTINAIRAPVVAVDATSFTEMSPILNEIRTLILTGDGSGRGVLARSRYQAEPMDLPLRDNDSEGARSSTRKSPSSADPSPG